MSGTQVQLTSPEAPAVAPAPEVVVDPNRPAWLPANFKTPEDFAKSYGELQSKSTRDSQELSRLKGQNVEVTGPDGKPVVEAPAETPPDDKTKETPKPNDPVTPPKIEEKKEGDEEDPAKKVAEAANFNLDTYQTEYFDTGDVTVENRAKIAEGLKGVLGDNAAEIVNQYIEGQKATHANDRKMYYDEAGGEDAYTGMVTWAAENLSKDEIGAFNKSVDSGDRHQVLLAVRGLRSTYEQKNGRVPNNIKASGGATPPTGSAPFNSSAEMTAAMRDPRYKTDQAYRDNVAARIAASPSL